jgi:hypothetical protein
MNGKPLRVLLVEDNVVSAQLTRTILTCAETSSFEVRTAETLMGALDLLGAGAFDLNIARPFAARQRRIGHTGLLFESMLFRFPAWC